MSTHVDWRVQLTGVGTGVGTGVVLLESATTDRWWWW